MAALIAVDVNEEFITRLAEAIAKANLRAGGVLPSTDIPPGAANGSQSLQGGSEPAFQGDPWAGTDTQPTQPPAAPTGTTTIQGKNGPIQVTFAAGPTCTCGVQSALYTGWTNGKQWRAYRCAKGAGPGDTWKSKCDFSQWA